MSLYTENVTLADLLSWPLVGAWYVAPNGTHVAYDAATPPDIVGAITLGDFATLGRNAHLANGSMVGAGTTTVDSFWLGVGSRIGERCQIGVSCSVLDGVVIGDDVVLGGGSQVASETAIGSSWTIGSHLITGTGAIIKSDEVQCTVLINGGASVVFERDVTLTLDAGLLVATEMAVRNDGDAYGAWQTYATTLPWTLAAGNPGPRKVWAKFRDSA